jgi:hypothetical protein
MTIWKFPLGAKDHQLVEMPPDAKILAVQVQGGKPVLWALVDPERRTEKRRAISLFCTGQPLANEPVPLLGAYLGTIQLSGGSLVLHAFDGGYQ